MARARRMQPSRRRQRERRGNVLGIVLMVFAFLVILAGGGTFAWFSVGRVELDEAFCPVDGPVSVTAVLVDQTDRFSAIQQADIRNRLEELKNSIPTHGRLAIYAVGSTAEGLREAGFALCNPGSGAEMSRWVSNPDLAHRRWEEIFDRPLQQAFEAMIAGGDAEQSPIFESIQSVALAEFIGPQKEAAKRLVIVSDMLQHTDGYSHYGTKSEELRFSVLAKNTYYQRIRTDLQGADVTILLLRRNVGMARKPDQHLGFWRDYLLEQGAADIRVVSIQG